MGSVAGWAFERSPSGMGGIRSLSTTGSDTTAASVVNSGSS
jgi:hypothetical protein